MKKRIYIALTLKQKSLFLFFVVNLIVSLHTITAQNLITNGDFSQAVGTGFTTDYNAAAGFSVQKNYTLGSNPQTFNGSFSTCTDHTTGTGNMMIVDGSASSGDKVWQQQPGGGIPITQGATYIFSYWIQSVSTVGGVVVNPANIQVKLNNTVLTPTSGSTIASTTICNWQQVTYSFVAPSGYAQIWLYDLTTAASGNDFAIDDISLTLVPPPLTIGYSVVNPSCAGSNDGFISVYGFGGYQPYTYSLNGGAYVSSNVFSNLSAASNNYVSVKDNTGIIVSSTATINVVAPVNTLSASNDTSICSGASVSLSASGGNGYAWAAMPSDATLTAPNNQSITVSPVQTTTYTVTSSAANTTMNLVYNPGFELGNNGFVSGYNYYTTTTNQTSYGVTPSPNVYDMYFNNCTDHTSGLGNMMVIDGATTSGVEIWGQTIPVTQNTNYTFSYWIQAVSTGSAAQVQTLINGSQTGAVMASTNNTAVACGWTQFTTTWNSGSSTSAAIALYDQNTVSIANDFALDDIYFALTNPTACTIKDSVKVTVTTGTTVTDFSYPASVCIYDADPTPTGVTGFTNGGTYSATPAGLTINPSTGKITLSTSIPNTYSVKYTVVANGCNPAGSSTANITITKPDAGVDQTINCVVAFPGGTATMAASGTGTWAMQPGNPGTATITTPLSPVTTITNFSAAGTYNFVWGNGTCIDTVSIQVTGKPNAGADQIVNCVAAFPGGIATMSATGTGTWTVDPANIGTASITTVSSSTTTITNFSIVGTYNFIWTNGTCSDTASITVTGKPNAGVDQTINCIASFPGGSATMAATGSGTWSAQDNNPGSAGITTASSSSTTITNFSTAGTYNFIWSNGTCTDTVSVMVIGKPTAGADQTVNCVAALPGGTATMAASGLGIWTAQAGNPGTASITTPTSATTTIMDFTSEGTYNFILTSGTCSDTASIKVTANPTVSVNADLTQVTTAGTTVTLTGISSTTGTYLWTASPESVLATPTALQTTTQVSGTTLYTLTVTAANNCQGNDTVRVSFINTTVPPCLTHIRKAFTPNGDGFNDKWIVFDGDCFTSAEVNVYNRWGGLVYHSDSYQNDWQGTYKGDALPDGTYYYVIHAKLQGNDYTSIFTGNVTILR